MRGDPTARSGLRDEVGRNGEAIAATPTPNSASLAEDRDAAWKAPGVTMRARQQLRRTLVNEITPDIDDEARQIILVIHWKGGQRSEVRLREPESGGHDCKTPNDALAIIRTMAADDPMRTSPPSSV